MSNFNIFDKAQLARLLEPFASSIADHITPIKYEALTPDTFVFLFCTTGENGDSHYFVSLETDFVSSLEGARCTIEDWHGTQVIDFWPLQKKRGKKAPDNIQDFQSATSGPYFAMLAEVERPTRKGYWADSVRIMPGDNIGDKIKTYPPKAQANIKKALAEVLQHQADASLSFLDSLNAKRQGTIKDDINQTDMAVTLYVQPDDSVELFYNYVHQKIRNRPRKSKPGNK